MFFMNTLHWKNLHDDFVKHTLANKILITFLLTNSLYNPPVKGNYKVKTQLLIWLNIKTKIQ